MHEKSAGTKPSPNGTDVRRYERRRIASIPTVSQGLPEALFRLGELQCRDPNTQGRPSERADALTEFLWRSAILADRCGEGSYFFVAGSDSLVCVTSILSVASLRGGSTTGSVGARSGGDTAVSADETSLSGPDGRRGASPRGNSVAGGGPAWPAGIGGICGGVPSAGVPGFCRIGCAPADSAASGGAAGPVGVAGICRDVPSVGVLGL